MIASLLDGARADRQRLGLGVRRGHDDLAAHDPRRRRAQLPRGGHRLESGERDDLVAGHRRIRIARLSTSSPSASGTAGGFAIGPIAVVADPVAVLVELAARTTRTEVLAVEQTVAVEVAACVETARALGVGKIADVPVIARVVVVARPGVVRTARGQRDEQDRLAHAPSVSPRSLRRRGKRRHGRAWTTVRLPATRRRAPACSDLEDLHVHLQALLECRIADVAGDGHRRRVLPGRNRNSGPGTPGRARSHPLDPALNRPSTSRFAFSWTTPKQPDLGGVDRRLRGLDADRERPSDRDVDVRDRLCWRSR